MKRRLFLSGPAFCGKSELIRQQLGTRLQWAGGFCTELSASEDGSFGCRMMPTAMAGGVEGYEKELDGLTVINRHEPETVTVSGKKFWDDDDDHDGLRPESVTVVLYKAGGGEAGSD